MSLIAPQAPPAEIGAGALALLDHPAREPVAAAARILRGSLPPASSMPSPNPVPSCGSSARRSGDWWTRPPPSSWAATTAAPRTPTVTQQLGFDGSGVTVCVGGYRSRYRRHQHHAPGPGRPGHRLQVVWGLPRWHAPDRRFRRLRPRHALRGHRRRQCRHGGD